MVSSSTPPTTKDKEINIWLKTIAIGFGLASIGTLIAVFLYLAFR